MKKEGNKVCKHCGKGFAAGRYIKHLRTYGDYLNVIEACSIYNVSRWTLRRMINNSKLKGKIEGRETNYPRLELDNLFKPVMRYKPVVSKRKLNPGSNVIYLYMECNGFIVSDNFKDVKISQQLKWINKHKKLHELNQEKFKAKQGNYTDWGKLIYLTRKGFKQKKV